MAGVEGVRGVREVELDERERLAADGLAEEHDLD